MRFAVSVLIGLVCVLAVSCGQGSAFSLEVGDCLDEPRGGEFSDVDKVSCDEPHELEVFALVDYPGGNDAPFPGADRLEQAALDLCFAFFEDYVDRPYPESLLDIATFNPTRDSWNEIDDREIVCLLYDLESAYMHESMKDSGR